MKKLLLSLAALVFATVLFTQQDTKDVNDNVTTNTIAKVQKNLQAEL